MPFGLLLAVAMAMPSHQALVKPKQKLTITKSSKIAPGAYLLRSQTEDKNDASIIVRGENLTVDFASAILEGSPQSTQPDERIGLGIYVEGKNITIKNAKVRGFKVGIMARNSPGLKLLDCDLSHNWKQHLMSTPDREDESDWMSYHQNEKDEWLRYGAGIYLRDCENFEVKGCRVNGGENGLMMTSCNKGKIWNNDFSFNSAIGVGMYRSSENKIMHNKIDWCVRGFSYGKYNRGQDSAGILIYEQSNKNTFAYNSVTHGGDGFFLWAGQTTMDTGKGGCNDNLLYGNDFSHAPTNGIEATFSRNVFANNLVLECWHGIWGGYSYDTKIIGNVFGYNAEGIAIEHGQDNLIQANRFVRNNEDIVIWANASQDPNWGYAKFRDTRSRNLRVEKNAFWDTWANVFRLARTQDVVIRDNIFVAPGSVIKMGEPAVTNLAVTKNEARIRKTEQLLNGNDVKLGVDFGPKPPASSLNQGDWNGSAEYLARFNARADKMRVESSQIRWMPFPPLAIGGSGNYNNERLITEGTLWAGLQYAPKPLLGGADPFLAPKALRGWRYMIVDEWGPYDFKRPILYPREEGQNGVKTFEVMGPIGTAKIIAKKGIIVESISSDGKSWVTPDDEIKQVVVPSFVRIRVQSSTATNALLSFEYVGSEVVDHRGVVIPKGRPFRFSWSKFEAPIEWNVRWYAWDAASVVDPRAKMPSPGELLSRTQLGKPIASAKTTKLDYVTGGSPHEGVPNDHFITLAEGSFSIEPGTYEIAATADDGIRLWLDDKLIVDEWHWQGPTRYAKTVKLGGSHRLRLEHYEIDGYTALKIEVAPKR